MAQLSVEKGRLFEVQDNPALVKLGVDASAKVYRGSALGLNSVSARQLVAGDTFLGFAEETKDNSSGSAGAITVAIRQRGTVSTPVTGASAATAYGTAVYMSDGDTATTTSTSNTQIGKVVRFVSGTTCLVYFEGVGVRS